MGWPFSTEILSGQPFALDLLESRRVVGRLVDPTLVPSLREGVPTGALDDSIPSGRWPPSRVERAFGLSLEWCEGSWKGADLDEAGLSALVQHETSDCFVAEFPGLWKTLTNVGLREWPMLN